MRCPPPSELTPASHERNESVSIPGFYRKLRLENVLKGSDEGIGRICGGRSIGAGRTLSK